MPEQRSISRRRASIARMHRRQARIYGAVAFFSAAAALVLAVGVVTGAFSRTPSQGDDVRTSQGGPGVGGDNRTDSPGSDAEEGGATSPARGTEASPESVPKAPENDGAEPEPEPESPAPTRTHGDVVEHPEPVNTPEREPVSPEPKDTPRDDGGGATVEKEKPEPTTPAAPDAGHSAAPPVTAPRELGSLTVLSGRIEALGRDGAWKRLGDTQVFTSGTNLRTNVNGVAVLSVGGTTLVLGKGSEVSFSEQGAASLVSGEVTLDRPTGRGGEEFDLRCGEYVVTLTHGCTVVTRKLHSIGVRHAVGFASVNNEQVGALLLDGGNEVEVDFGKAYATPKAGRILLPDWSGEARALAVLTAIDATLMAREWKGGERRIVDRALPSDLERIMRHPVESDRMVEFLGKTIGNTAISGRALCQIVGEVENAFIEEADFLPGEITRHAGTAVEKAKDFSDWQVAFKLLLHPPVPRPASASKEPDCPAEEKPGRTPRVPRRITDAPEEVPGK